MKARTPRKSQRTTVNCYAFFEKVFPACGLLDYSEGMYHGNPETPYEEAQQNQLNYLLDEVTCDRDVRILEIGCGNGTLLEKIKHRGAIGIGITISPDQTLRCRKRGLDVRLLDYKDISDEWTDQFDAVIANGPIEHFVQASDATQNRADEIYHGLFEICHRVIDPKSPICKFVNTTIHFIRRPDPAHLLRSPFAFRPFSDSFHYAFLNRSFGGFYPSVGQLEACAQPFFELKKTVDGTFDYHLTSEEWLRRIQRDLRSVKKLPAIFARSLPFLLRHPRQAAAMLTCMLVTQSWNWQFRSANPPTTLLRQTWAYRQ